MKKEIWTCPDFSLADTLECGQCFRYEKLENDQYTVIASGRVVTLGQEDGSIVFYGDCDIPFWKAYFDGERDYGALKRRLCQGDQVMVEAVSFAPGIRIIRQAFFETLLSFILSQNNHIPRIRGLIRRLSETYGTKLQEGVFAFPTAEEMAKITEADLRALGCGFRARYIVDAVEKVLGGGYEEGMLNELSTEEIRRRLMEICGVGQKVADCILLFSLGRYEVFPADVWIRRVFGYAYCQGAEIPMKELQQEAEKRFGEHAGFAQQYLFHYGRQKKIGKAGN